MKLSITSLIALAHLIPGLQAVPIPGGESCTCQPLPPFKRHSESYNNSLASCNRIARHIERWRWPLHSPKLADAFVDVSQLELQRSSGGGASEKSMSTLPITNLRHSPSRPTTIQKHDIFMHIENTSKSRGTYIESQQRFRIVCQPRAPTVEPFAPRPLHSLIAIFVGMTLIWLFVFELMVQIWLR